MIIKNEINHIFFNLKTMHHHIIVNKRIFFIIINYKYK